MSSTSNNKKFDIKIHGFYAYIKGLEKGLGLVVFSIGDTVDGVKLGIGKTEKFTMKRDEFDALLAYDAIEFVEVLPKFVWKDLRKTYNK